jgi:hypothetical protein
VISIVFIISSIYESSLIACIPYASFFLLISMTRNAVTISVFWLLGGNMVLRVLELYQQTLPLFYFHDGEHHFVPVYILGRYEKSPRMTIIFDNFFNDFHYVMTPIPHFPRGGHVFVHKFCIYFWKG